MPDSRKIEKSELTELKRNLRGSVIVPGDRDYDEARAMWNGIYDRRPAAIVRCAGTADVIAAVDFARELGIPLSVKSTGHSYAGNSVCDDGLVIDLSQMKSIRIDASKQSARVQPGVTWGMFDHEAQAFGLATTGGTVSTVGVAGYSLGGGTGYLARKYGLALDNLISLEVVTADGNRVHASEDENPDLFWGMRGGSGNLGVVTSLEFRLHEVETEVLAGQIVYPFDQAREVLRFWRDFMDNAPEEVQCYAFIIHVPPIPAFPEQYHGKTALDLVVAYIGDPSEGERILKPLRDVGDPILDGVFPQAYTALQQTFDAGMPKGLRWYSRAHYLDAISDDAIDTILRHTDPMPGAFTAVYFEPCGGAIARVDERATAFPHRSAAYGLHVFPGWTDPVDDDTNIEWARRLYDDMSPFATGGVYLNLLGPDENERVNSALGANYGRMAKVKATYDPMNLFRQNHNVAPASSS